MLKSQNMFIIKYIQYFNKAILPIITNRKIIFSFYLFIKKMSKNSSWKIPYFNIKFIKQSKNFNEKNSIRIKNKNFQIFKPMMGKSFLIYNTNNNKKYKKEKVITKTFFFSKYSKPYRSYFATYYSSIKNFIKKNYEYSIICFFFIYIIPFFFIFFFWIFLYYSELNYFFYDISLDIFVPNNFDQAGLNKMVIVFRQFILEHHSWITLKLTSSQLSDVALEMMGILSEMLKNNPNVHSLAFEYFQNPDIFVEKYSSLYCFEFESVRAKLSDRFNSDTLNYAKYFIKEIIEFSINNPDSEIAKYVKLIKIKKWTLLIFFLK